MFSRPRGRQRMATRQLEVVAPDRWMVLIERDTPMQTTNVVKIDPGTLKVQEKKV